MTYDPNIDPSRMILNPGASDATGGSVIPQYPQGSDALGGQYTSRNPIAAQPSGFENTVNSVYGWLAPYLSKIRNTPVLSPQGQAVAGRVGNAISSVPGALSSAVSQAANTPVLSPQGQAVANRIFGSSPPTSSGGESPIVQPPAGAPSSSPPQGSSQPPGTTLNTVPPQAGGFTTNRPDLPYGPSSQASPARPYTPTPGAVQGQPSPGQTSQNAPPTNPNQPRGTDQATPTTGYYTPTTGIGRGPGTWHPGSIADAIHNAGVGLGQHLDQTFGVQRPPGYYDYRGQGQPTYNGPLSQQVVNNMGGRVNQAGVNTAPLQPRGQPYSGTPPSQGGRYINSQPAGGPLDYGMAPIDITRYPVRGVNA